MDTLNNWKARRSGGRITIVADDDTGASDRYANIDVIELEADGKVVATNKDGERFELAIRRSFIGSGLDGQ